MRQYFKTSQLSEEEKSDILSKHRTTYNGFKAMHPEIKNTPLYVQDFIGDKDGMVINNKGEVKKYTNFGINESKGETCEQCGREMNEGECMECGKMYESNGETCEQCGKRINEGETCEQCGKSNESYDEMKEISADKLIKGKKYKYKSPSFEDEIEYDETQEYPDGEPMHAFKGKNASWHSMGDLSFVHDIDDIDEDIYDVEDLNPDAGFDYLEGKSNRKNAFKKKNFELDEDYLESFDFQSQGPGLGDAYPVNEYVYMESAWADDLNEDISGVQGIYGDMEPAYDFDSEGPGKAGPYQISRNEYGDEEYPESVKLPEFEYGNEEGEGDGEHPESVKLPEIEDGFTNYFDDDYDAIHNYLKKHGDDDEYTPTEDLGYATHTGDFGDDDSEYGNEDRETAISRFRRKGEKDIEDIDFEELDEDIKESFENQKNKINEMFNRMSKYN